MKSAKAFAPANISCIFKIYEHKNPRWAGSYGMGFTLSDGVIVSVSKSKKNEVLLNGKKINFPTVKRTAQILSKQNFKISLKTSLPLGCGFGLSGASSLAAAYAINRILNLKKTVKELAVIAHTSEVENKTGLGDVVNQYYGGFCLKLTPSSFFVVKKIPLNGTEVYCRHFSKLSTKSVISNPNMKGTINKSATESINKVGELIKNKKIDFGEVISLSKEFAQSSELLKDKKTIKTIEEIEKKGGRASMIMLGNSVFSNIKFPGSKKYLISNKGAHLL